MTKRTKNEGEGEQLDLIDVKPENAKKILKAAKAYKKVQKIRLSALDEEKQQKQKVLDLIKNAGLTPMSDGTIKFRLDSFQISVTPRDELLQVKCEEEESVED